MKQRTTTCGRDDQRVNVAGRGKANFLAWRHQRQSPRGSTLRAGRKQPAKGAGTVAAGRQTGEHFVSGEDCPIDFGQPVGLGTQSAAQLSGDDGPAKSCFGGGTERQRRDTVGGMEPIEECAGKRRFAVELICEPSMTRPATCQRSSSGAMRGQTFGLTLGGDDDLSPLGLILPRVVEQHLPLEFGGQSARDDFDEIGLADR